MQAKGLDHQITQSILLNLPCSYDAKDVGETTHKNQIQVEQIVKKLEIDS